MAFRIQRVPRGFNELLSIFGGQTPIELEDRARAVVELTQFYALQQRVAGGETDVLAEGATLLISLDPNILPFTRNWAVLFSANANVVKTGTMTACRLTTVVTRGGGEGIPFASADMGPFGATETGNASLPFVAPYPMLLPPPWDVGAFLGILGTDATATVSIQIEIGVLQ